MFHVRVKRRRRGNYEPAPRKERETGMAESLSAETHDAVMAEAVGTKRADERIRRNQAVMPPSFLVAHDRPHEPVLVPPARRRVERDGVGSEAGGNYHESSAVQRLQYAPGRLKTGDEQDRGRNTTPTRAGAAVATSSGSSSEGMKFRLADNTFFTPDFAVMLVDGQPRHQCKSRAIRKTQMRVKAEGRGRRSTRSSLYRGSRSVPGAERRRLGDGGVLIAAPRFRPGKTDTVRPQTGAPCRATGGSSFLPPRA